MPRHAPAAAERTDRRPPRTATLRRQYVDCGRCTKWHGPYWYAFWRVGGRVRSAYVGRDDALERLLRAWGSRRTVDELEAAAGEPSAPRARGPRRRRPT